METPFQHILITYLIKENNTGYLLNITKNESNLIFLERFKRLTNDNPNNDPEVVNIEEELPILSDSFTTYRSLPLTFRKGNFGFLTFYQYHISVELPGQHEELDNNSFITSYVSYLFQLSRHQRFQVY